MDPVMNFVAETAIWGSIGLLLWGAALTLQHVFASDHKRQPARDDAEQRPVRAGPERLALWLVAAAALVLPAPGANAQDEYEPAMEAIPSCADPCALEALRTGAESGDVRAQEVLGFMLLNGERLYGPGVHQNIAEGLMWLRRAAEHGSAVAGFIVARAEQDAARVPTAVAQGGRPATAN